MIIAIDGPAGAGKTTISKFVSEKLKINYLNSGAFYRALTFIMLENNSIGVEDLTTYEITKYIHQVIVNLNWQAPNIILNLSQTKDFSTYHILELASELYTVEIDMNVAQISRIVAFREAINNKIREICMQGKGWVVEGRDVGSIIFPEAEYKFYLDANIKTRSERRLKDYKNSKQNDIIINSEKVKNMIKDRDIIDKNKGEYSLNLTKGTKYINTTGKSIEQILEILYNIIYSDI